MTKGLKLGAKKKAMVHKRPEYRFYPCPSANARKQLMTNVRMSYSASWLQPSRGGAESKKKAVTVRKMSGTKWPTVEVGMGK